MEKRFTTEEMGKMVLEQAKSEALVNYMKESMLLIGVNAQMQTV